MCNHGAAQYKGTGIKIKKENLIPEKLRKKRKVGNKMNPTKIEWCDFTWNPVTGCEHGCEYCYARKIAKSFAASFVYYNVEGTKKSIKHLTETARAFKPIFWEARLDQPAKRKKPARIFVVSTGDLFGEWVPDEWIEQVFKACEAAPQHTYYFLTKNPARYWCLRSYDCIEDNKNWYFGASYTGGKDKWLSVPSNDLSNRFISLEPILEYNSGYWSSAWQYLDWFVVGAETGNRRGKIIPKREWLLDIRKQCKELGIPLFEKNSLAQFNLPGGLIQEWPKEEAQNV
jgi:protein gp37